MVVLWIVVEEEMRIKSLGLMDYRQKRFQGTPFQAEAGFLLMTYLLRGRA